MKNVLYSIIGLLIISCTKANLNENRELSKPKMQTIEILTIDEALMELDDFNESLYGNISVKSRDQIANIEVCKVPSTKCEIMQDVLAYVVNYEEDAGFAVINADKFSVPIIVRAEAGNINYKRLNDKISQIQGVNMTKSGVSNDDINDNMSPEDFIYTSIANYLVATPRITIDTLSITYGDWIDRFSYGPFVSVKWGQKYPFNIKIPQDSYWVNNKYNDYRGLPPVGCSNVALGQILATIKQPSRAPGVNTTYDWGVLRSISNYSNLTNYLPGQDIESYPFYTNPVLMSKVEDLADFLYVLYDKNDSYPDQNGTSTFISDVLLTMKELNSSYFANAEIIEYEDDPYAIVDCLESGKPVFCRGSYGYNTGGHAWVIDGDSKRERQVTIMVQSGYGNPQTQIRPQIGYFFHINWGYNGKYDGYYSKGVFDMTQREDINEIIDTNPHTANGTASYPNDIKYISY